MNEYGAFADATHDDTEWDIRACVVRLPPSTLHHSGNYFTSGGPYIHANASHVSSGVTGVAVSADGNLQVLTDGGSPIGAVLAVPDETLAARGIILGPSGGASNTSFVFYQSGFGRLDLSLQAHWDRVASTLSNVWVAWFTPRVRGTGQASKADRALAAVSQIQTDLDVMSDRIDAVTALLDTHTHPAIPPGP